MLNSAQWPKPLPGKKQELLALFKNVVTESRKESGCVFYECCEKGDNIIFIQKWKTEADLLKHKKQPHVQDVKPKIKELIEGEVIISKCPILI